MNDAEDKLWRELAALDEPTVEEMAAAERALDAESGAPPLDAADIATMVARATAPAATRSPVRPVRPRRRLLVALAGILLAAVSISWVARELWPSRRNSAFELDLPSALAITHEANWTAAERLSAIGFVQERCVYAAEHLLPLMHDQEPQVAQAATQALAVALQRLGSPAERVPEPCADQFVELVQRAEAPQGPAADRISAIDGLQHLLEEGILGMVGCELTGEADAVRDAFVGLLRERLQR